MVGVGLLRLRGTTRFAPRSASLRMTSAGVGWGSTMNGSRRCPPAFLFGGLRSKWIWVMAGVECLPLTVVTHPKVAKDATLGWGTVIVGICGELITGSSRNNN